MKMEAGLVVKVSGERKDIQEILEFLETKYLLRRVSRVLKNQRGLGFFVFADLTPRKATRCV